MHSNGKRIFSILLKFIFTLTFLFISLFSYSNEPARFIQLTMDNGLANNKVTSFVEDSNDFLWFGTFSGLSRYDGYQFTSYFRMPNDPSSLSDDYIMDLATDKYGNVWIGTYSGGLNRLNTKTQVITHYTHNANNFNSIRDNRIYSLYLENDKRLWIATDKGLDVFDIQSEEFIHTDLAPSPTPNVTDMLMIKNDLWLATYSGLYIYNTITHKINILTHNPKVENSLSTNLLNTLFHDHDGQIWVGSIGSEGD